MVTAANSGFTLLELLVVLAILSLLAGVAVPHFPSGGVDAATAARDLGGALVAVRSRALMTGHPASLIIDAAEGRYGIDEAKDGLLPAGLALHLSLPPGQAAGGRMASITFFPDGGSTGGDLLITGRGRDAGLSIDWLTGGIRHVP